MAIGTWADAKNAILIGLIAANMAIIGWAVSTIVVLYKDTAVMESRLGDMTEKVENYEVKKDKKDEQQDKRISQLEAILPASTRPTKQTTYEIE